jgi:hypothetical protein
MHTEMMGRSMLPIANTKRHIPQILPSIAPGMCRINLMKIDLQLFGSQRTGWILTARFLSVNHLNGII